MKRKILLLVMAMALILTACGGSGRNDEVTRKEPGETETEAENTDSEEGADDAAAAAPAVQTEEADEEEEITAAKEEPAETEESYVKGTVTEEGWESEFFGLRYAAPENMGMATEEYLNELMGLGKEILSESFTEQQLKYAEMRTVYEMMSLDTAGSGFNVLVMAEKLPLINMSSEQYKRSFVQQLSQVEGATLVSDDETAEIAGEEYLLVCSQVEAQGNVMYQNYYFRVLDDRAMSIVITYTDETQEMIETVMNAFEPY